MRITRFTLLILLVLPVAACDDDWGPEFWVASEDTVVLFSLAREEYTGLPAAYDFLNREPVRIELASAGSWDIALSEDSSGLVLLPLGAFPAQSSVAGIAELEGLAFYDVTAAPRDGALYDRSGPIILRAGVIYVVRSREYAGACVSYTKVEPLELEAVAGTFRFRYINNPHCGDRALVPPGNS